MKPCETIGRLVAVSILSVMPVIVSTQKQSTTPDLLVERQNLYFNEPFTPDRLSERLWYNARWKAEDGILNRLPGGDSTTRVFLRDANYRDCLIRFDFRIGQSQDIRLMTGSSGRARADC